MFITSPIGVIIGGILGLVMVFALGLISGGVLIGAASVIGWIIVAALILIWKMSQGGNG
jgi:hypothetical protein